MSAGKTRYWLAGTLAVLLCFALFQTLLNRIGGGAPMEKRVVAALKTNTFLVRAFKGSIIKIGRSDGPWRVNLNANRLRNGFYSFLVEGIQTNGTFKVEWAETQDHEVIISSISLQAPFRQDRLLWREGTTNQGTLLEKDTNGVP